MKKRLETWGIKVNNSMSKNLIARLYKEISEYMIDGQIPDHLTADESTVPVQTKQTRPLSAQNVEVGGSFNSNFESRVRENV
mgnify:CR=1 FL=1